MRKIIYLTLVCVLICGCVVFAQPASCIHMQAITKNDMVYIDGISIPSIKLVESFYIPVSYLEYYGFESKYDESNNTWYVNRNPYSSLVPITDPENTVTILDNYITTKVDLDGEIVPCVEGERGAIYIDIVYLEKYGNLTVSDDKVIFNFFETSVLPGSLPFMKVVNVYDSTEIKSGKIYFRSGGYAELSLDDIKKYFDVHLYCKYYDRIVAPKGDYTYDYYFEFIRENDEKLIVLGSSAVLMGKFGEAYMKDGVVYENYIWYKPYIGNGANAMYTVSNELFMKYKDSKTDCEYEESVIWKDKENLLITESCSPWANDYVEKAASLNLLPYEFTEKYTENISRKDFALIAARMIATYKEPHSDSRTGTQSALHRLCEEKGIPVNTTSVFTDCDDIYVDYLAKLGIIKGVSSELFAPNESITRQEAATILYRISNFLDLNKNSYESADYADNLEVSSWAVEAINAMTEMKIMQGVGDMRFDPLGYYTREQAITTMLRLYEY